MIVQPTSPAEAGRPRRQHTLWEMLLRIPELILAALVATLVVFLTANVVGRYVFDIGIVWSDEAARVMFIWVVFLGFAVGLRHRGNIGVDFLVDRLRAPWKRAVGLFQDASILLFSLFFLWQSVITLKYSFIQRLPALQVSIAWLYAAVVVAAVLMSIYSAANLWDSLRGRANQADEMGHDAARHVE
jgi:TRAP-type C4-dicarboxylate transport system permease small subunit